MGLELSLYDTADYLTDRETIFHYLSLELESNEPPYAARALGNVIRARGGVEKLSEETGVAIDDLNGAVRNEGKVNRDVLLRVIAAFREDATSKVA